MTHIYHFQNTQIAIPATSDIRKVYLELSSECNFACEMCFRHSFSAPIGSMSQDVLDRVQAELATLLELQEVVLGGLGEPLLHPSIREVISWIKCRDLLLTLTTNGVLLEPLHDFLIDQGVDRIVISCETGDIGHALTQKVFDVLKSLCQAKKQKNASNPEIWLSMVVTKNNIRDLPLFAGFLREVEVKRLILSNLLPATQEQAALVLYPLPKPEEITMFEQTILRDAGIYCSTPQFEIATERFCEFIEQHAVVIRWDGEIAPCYRFLYPRREIVLNTVKDVNAYSFGNIQAKSLLDIWGEREYTWLRFMVHNSLYPSCLDCPFRDGCGYLLPQETDCWGNKYFCADCMWARGFVKCL